VLALSEKFPQHFDQRAVLQRIMKQMKIPNVSELMPSAAEPIEINAAEENAAMCIGRAAFAYPHQNQLAHLQAHLDFALDPLLGGNPIIAPAFLPKFLEHFKQHLMLWYLGHMNGYVEKSLGKPVKDYDIAGVTGEVDKLYALASQLTKEDVKESFASVMPALGKVMQMMQGLAPKPQMDGGDQVIMQTSMAETQRRAAKDQADIALAERKLDADTLLKNRQQQIEIALNASDRLTEERIKSAELTQDAAILQHEQQQTALAAQESAQTALGGPNVSQ
jgi:hypothetical protein